MQFFDFSRVLPVFKRVLKWHGRKMWVKWHLPCCCWALWAQWALWALLLLSSLGSEKEEMLHCIAPLCAFRLFFTLRFQAFLHCVLSSFSSLCVFRLFFTLRFQVFLHCVFSDFSTLCFQICSQCGFYNGQFRNGEDINAPLQCTKLHCLTHIIL